MYESAVDQSVNIPMMQVDTGNKTINNYTSVESKELINSNNEDWN